LLKAKTAAANSATLVRAGQCGFQQQVDETGENRISAELYRAVVIAMVPVGMMEVAIDQVIDVIAVRYGFVPASRAVDVARVMGAAIVVRRTLIRVFCADLERVFVDVIAMRMVQMSIMQVIDVVAMPDGGMSAVCTMLVIVMGMVRFVAGAHAYAPRFIRQCGNLSP
jgi:hypothetical protein